MPKREANKSFVWDYFEKVGSDSDTDGQVKKCKKCSYVLTSKSSSTSSMVFHLQHKHGISRTSIESEVKLHKVQVQDGDNILKQSSFSNNSNRSSEEWCTY